MSSALMSLEDRFCDACVRAVAAEQDRLICQQANGNAQAALTEGKAVVMALLAMLPGLPEKTDEAGGLERRARAWLAAIG